MAVTGRIYSVLLGLVFTSCRMYKSRLKTYQNDGFAAKGRRLSALLLNLTLPCPGDFSARESGSLVALWRKCLQVRGFRLKGIRYVLATSTTPSTNP